MSLIEVSGHDLYSTIDEGNLGESMKMPKDAVFVNLSFLANISV